MSNIRVCCRFRPQNQDGAVNILGNQVNFTNKEFQGEFTFDQVFDGNVGQESVFNDAVKCIVDGLNFINFRGP